MPGKNISKWFNLLIVTLLHAVKYLIPCKYDWNLICMPLLLSWNCQAFQITASPSRHICRFITFQNSLKSHLACDKECEYGRKSFTENEHNGLATKHKIGVDCRVEFAYIFFEIFSWLQGNIFNHRAFCFINNFHAIWVT